MMRRLIDFFRRAFARHPPCDHRWARLQTINGLYVTYVLQCKRCGDLKRFKV
jgi:hypothetical protein